MTGWSVLKTPVYLGSVMFSAGRRLDTAYDDSQLTLMTDDILTKCEMLRFG